MTGILKFIPTTYFRKLSQILGYAGELVVIGRTARVAEFFFRIRGDSLCPCDVGLHGWAIRDI